MAFKGERVKEKVSYSQQHLRVISAKGQPSSCTVCGTTDPSKNYDWANLTGNYDNINDYARMCRSCHWKRDKKVLNIHAMRDAKPLQDVPCLYCTKIFHQAYKGKKYCSSACYHKHSGNKNLIKAGS